MALLHTDMLAEMPLGPGSAVGRPGRRPCHLTAFRRGLGGVRGYSFCAPAMPHRSRATPGDFCEATSPGAVLAGEPTTSRHCEPRRSNPKPAGIKQAALDCFAALAMTTGQHFAENFPGRGDRRPSLLVLLLPGVISGRSVISGGVNFAGRFSTKAAMPSFWSSVANSDWNTRRSKRTPSASVVSKARFTASLPSSPRAATAPRSVSGGLQRLGDQIGGRHDAADQPGALGLGGVHHPAGQAHLHRLGLADGAGEALRAARCRG